MDRAELVAAISEALHDHRSVTDEVHKEHHAFIEFMIEREKRRAERVQTFQRSFIGALAVGAVTALAWVGKTILAAVR